jgi:transcriptional regulator with XRE-family HTH domain
MSARTAPNNILGDTIKRLLKARGMKAYELGEDIALSPTSISKIMNGVSRPRQNTFTRMCQVLCQTKEEERRLVAAFAGTEYLEEEPDQALPSAEKEILRLRAEQFMERKTQSIQFKRSVARELDKAGIAYKQDYCEGIYSTDFLVEIGGKRIALECKANVGRDLEKTEMICRTLKEALNIAQVVIVVPFSEDESVVNYVAVSELAETLIKC